MIKRGKYIAVRPNSLIEARYDLKPKQNDILDMVLSRIDNDNNYLYELNITDYKNLYKTDSSNVYRDFKKAVKEFEDKGFYLIDTKNNKEIFFTWFASIAYSDNEGKIVVEIGNRLKSLLVEMKKRIFYKIEYPLNFSSIYSKRIYYYLKSFQDTGWRLDNLDVLRKKLQCPESYDKYSFFKIKVLEQAKKEINKSSDINFNYEEIKTGRRVSQIKFLIKQDKILNEVAVNAPDAVTPKEIVTDLNDINPILEVKKIIKESLTDLELQRIIDAANSDINKVKEKYEIISKMGKVNNIVGAMLTALKEDWQMPKGKDTFNNYEQHKYDFENLEKRLLGWK